PLKDMKPQESLQLTSARPGTMDSEVTRAGGVSCSNLFMIPNSEDQSCSYTAWAVSANSCCHGIRRSGIVFASWSLVRGTSSFVLLCMLHSPTLGPRFDMVRQWSLLPATLKWKVRRWRSLSASNPIDLMVLGLSGNVIV